MSVRTRDCFILAGDLLEIFLVAMFESNPKQISSKSPARRFGWRFASVSIAPLLLRFSLWNIYCFKLAGDWLELSFYKQTWNWLEICLCKSKEIRTKSGDLLEFCWRLAGDWLEMAGDLLYKWGGYWTAKQCHYVNLCVYHCFQVPIIIIIIYCLRQVTRIQKYKNINRKNK